MSGVPASFIGTSVATVVGTAYAILDEDRYILWTDFTRSMLMGGAALVLICYSVIWFLVERQTETQKRKQKKPLLEYSLMMTGHLLLGLALAWVSTDLSIYLYLFSAFIAVSFLWTILVANSRRSLFAHECINFVLCIAFVVVAFQLYNYAAQFEFAYPAMSRDPSSYEVFRSFWLGQISDTNSMLGFIVGMVFVNLLVLVAGRFSWLSRVPPSRQMPGSDADGRTGN